MGNTTASVISANNPKRNCLSIGYLVYLIGHKKRPMANFLPANIELRLQTSK
jgi:hypothetical protein